MTQSIRILIAEDDPISSHRLCSVLSFLGHEVTVCPDGAEAWELFLAAPFPLVISDWKMPRLDGLELCRRVREHQNVSGDYAYVILVTGADEGLVEGMAAGADDFILKPVRPAELRARLQAGLRVLALESTLQARVEQLEQALAQVRRLEGLLPICSYCKSIRQETQEWTSIERFVAQRTEACFSHSICPSCYETEVVPELKELEQSLAMGPDTLPGPRS